MGKTGCGGLLGMIIVGLGAPSLGLVLLSLVGVQFAGQALGENQTTLTIYIISTALLAYGVPLYIAVAVTEEQNILYGIGALLASLMAASIIFAIPSSFVTVGGCKAGNDRAVWAMRASIPLLAGMEQAFATEEDKMTCEGFK